MRHLAQIYQHPQTCQTQLMIVAQEHSDGSWEIYKYEERYHLSYADANFPEGSLVLIQLDQHEQIITIQEATEWLLNVLQHYFRPGKITPEFVRQEQQKIEAWRQQITAQSQDFTRRQLELEVRRDQLEALEQKLSES